VFVEALVAKSSIEAFDLSVLVWPSWLDQAQQDAVTTRERSAVMPEVPTVAESGLADYEYSVWSGLIAPAKTPPQIVNRLHAAIAESLRSPDVVERFRAQGGSPVGSSPQEFGKFLNVKIEKWRRVVKVAGMT